MFQALIQLADQCCTYCKWHQPLEMSRSADASAPLACASSLRMGAARFITQTNRYTQDSGTQSVATRSHLNVLSRTLPFRCACSSTFFRRLQKLSCCWLMGGRFM